MAAWQGGHQRTQLLRLYSPELFLTFQTPDRARREKATIVWKSTWQQIFIHTQNILCIKNSSKSSFDGFRSFLYCPIHILHKFQVIGLHLWMVTCGLKPCINTILVDSDKLIIKRCKGVVYNPRLLPSSPLLFNNLQSTSRAGLWWGLVLDSSYSPMNGKRRLGCLSVSTVLAAIQTTSVQWENK